MNQTFSPKMDILLSAQRRLWPEFRPSAQLGLVLYGGTAIAIRLGHRTSVDFDFFTEKSLDKEQLKKSFPFLASAQVLQDSPDSLTVLVSNSADSSSVKLSFFGSIHVGRVGIPEQTVDGVLQVASLEDLLALKLKVLLQRVEAKDYMDIVALLKSGLSLEHGLASARALHGVSFQPAECLKALVYFEGGDLSALSSEDRHFLVATAKTIRNLPIVSVRSKTLL